MSADFPPGEAGQIFNSVDALEEGGFVYVRMQVMRARPSDTGCFQLRLLMSPASPAFGASWQAVMVPRSQIVCREPRVMLADGGLVRGLE